MTDKLVDGESERIRILLIIQNFANIFLMLEKINKYKF